MSYDRESLRRTFIQGRKETLIKPLLLIFALLLGFSQVAVSAETGSKEEVPTDLDRVRVGQPAPDFTLEDSDGKNVSLADYRGKKNVVLIFYRGHW
jgi:cytochrome oxidase Cu insertion factor (SCO1/SenC/PrrC family)